MTKRTKPKMDREAEREAWKRFEAQYVVLSHEAEEAFKVGYRAGLRRGRRKLKNVDLYRGPGDTANCPAQHGSQCCGYPDVCREAMSGRREKETKK